jgi:signal transduction histidine kinase
MVPVWAVIAALLLCIALLIGRLYMLRQAAREIAEGFRNSLTSDTNVLIDISSRDRQMCALAAEINGQLRLLRRQQNRYMSGDREVKDAIANVSHDLRTPLTAICGYIELLEREEQSEAARRYISVVKERAEAMKTMTEELFGYSLTAFAAEAPELERVNINGALEEAIAAHYAELHSRGIVPQIRMPDAPVVRELNRAALARIFGNLITNAARHSDGDLSITLSEDGVTAFSNAASGLDEIQVGRLFDRFYTVESASQSTGLGLSIAKKLTEQMGGRIGAALSGKVLTVSVSFSVRAMDDA